MGRRIRGHQGGVGIEGVGIKGVGTSRGRLGFEGRGGCDSGWIHRSKPSYIAMCYTILHDLDALAMVFERHAEWAGVGSLEELAERLWGVLDHEWLQCN